MMHCMEQAELSGVSKCFETGGWLWKVDGFDNQDAAKPIEARGSRLASDMQLKSSQQNSGGHWLALQPLSN